MLWFSSFGNEVNPKTHNHWKMFLQMFILFSGPFVHINIINFFISYCPRFGDFRKNKAGEKWVGCVNFIIDFILTTPLLFLLSTFYETGIYIILPIAFFLTYLLPFFNKIPNIISYGNNPRRTIVKISEGKFKFTFLDYQLCTVFSLICFAIIFCDTSLFDNNLSKTQENGVGTMDLGAGLILFTSGVTARQARGKSFV